MITQKNPLYILALVFFVLMITAVFLVNHWITKEVDRANEYKRQSPQPSSTEFQLKPIGKPKAAKKLIDQGSAATIVDQEPPEASPPPSREKDKKVIYETPLDDVILVQ